MRAHAEGVRLMGVLVFLEHVCPSVTSPSDTAADEHHIHAIHGVLLNKERMRITVIRCTNFLFHSEDDTSTPSSCMSEQSMSSHHVSVSRFALIPALCS
jgi:hypothetical protein